MAAWRLVLYLLMVFLATSSTAPSNGGNVLAVPEECKGKQYCTVKPEGYDELEKKINAALPPFLIQEFKHRDNSPGDDEDTGLSPKSDWHNCPYEVKRESMFHIRNDNEMAYSLVVQTNLLYQDIKTVECAHKYIEDSVRDREECFGDLNLNTLSLKSTCKTVYGKRSLYVFDFETSQVVLKEFSIPVCCSCVVQDVFKHELYR